MKRFKSIKNKIIMCLLALVFPLSTMGVLLLTTQSQTADAAITYSTSYHEEQTVTNNSFSSGVTNFSLNDSLSGWSALNPTGKKATSGIITTGSRFQDYGSNRFYLRNNPKTADKDAYVLMINSKYSNSPIGYETSKGYETQGTLTLNANSYYYFQVAYNSDSNYDSHKEYSEFGHITQDDSITPAQFGYVENGDSVGFNEYIRYTPKDTSTSGEYYIHKTLNPLNRQTTDDAIFKNVTRFYEDAKYFGFLLVETADEDVTTTTPVYVDREAISTGDNGTYTVNKDYDLYTCPIEYDPDTKEYKIKASDNLPYYKAETIYDSENYPVIGSMYVDGLKDADGKAVDCEITKVSSTKWVNFYFFIATGNEEQTVNFQLWLGTKDGPSSSGVVFYDAAHLYRCSENYFWDTYETYKLSKKITETHDKITTERSCVTLTDLRDDKTLSLSQLREETETNYNLDFENSDLQKYWTVDEQGFGNAKIFSRKNAQEVFKNETGYGYVGTDLSKKATFDTSKNAYNYQDNDRALALWADDNYAKVTLKTPIDIAANEIYKIKVHYKVSDISDGSAYVSLSENKDRILDFYADLKDIYTYADDSYSSAITTNVSDSFANNYGCIEFYVKGGALYRSAVDLSLSLGKAKSGDTAAELATGCILFDNITIEKASSSDYETAANKIELGTNTVTQDNGVTNGGFDLTTTTEGLPTPNSWTVSNGSSEYTYYGVVNTDSKFWNSYSKKYTDEGNENYRWTDRVKTNPGKIPSYPNQTNNVLMLANLVETYQSISSSPVSLSTGYKKVVFDYYVSTGCDLYVDLVSTNGEFSLYSKKITGTNGWKQFEIPMNIENSVELYIRLSLGKNSNTQKVEGYAFFDNFAIKDDTQEHYDTTNIKERVDLGNFYYNLQTNEIPEELGGIKPDNAPAYNCTPTANPTGSQGFNGGLVKGKAFENRDFYKSDMEDKVFFYITVPNEGSYTIDSNFSFDLKPDLYYKLSFKLKNFFQFDDTAEDDDISYGTTVGLTGFDYANEIKTDEEGFEEYSIYLHPTAEATAKLHIALACTRSDETYGGMIAGTMIVYDFNLDSTITESEYTNVQKEIEKKDYNGNSFVAKSTEENTDEDNTDTDTDTDTSTDTSSNTNNDSNWLLIPSLITAAAIIIAVIGFVLRKIKIKKIEKKRKETYDRKGSLNIDAIKLAARKERDAEVEKVNKEIERFETELQKLETEHKQKVINMRAADKGKVSKSTDKEFKNFAQRRTVIAERIEVLKKQTEELQTPEHLLSLERKLYAQEDLKQRELQKASEKLNKEKKLANDKSEENDNSKTRKGKK